MAEQGDGADRALPAGPSRQPRAPSRVLRPPLRAPRPFRGPHSPSRRAEQGDRPKHAAGPPTSARPGWGGQAGAGLPRQGAGQAGRSCPGAQSVGGSNLKAGPGLLVFGSGGASRRPLTDPGGGWGGGMRISRWSPLLQGIQTSRVPRCGELGIHPKSFLAAASIRRPESDLPSHWIPPGLSGSLGSPPPPDLGAKFCPAWRCSGGRGPDGSKAAGRPRAEASP